MDDYTGRIQKGKISTIEGYLDDNENPTQARVVPLMMDETVTQPLTLPWYLRGGMGELEPETEVLFVLFEDQSGYILARADGEWPGVLEGDLEITGGLEMEGSLKAQDLETDEVASYNEHKHGDVEAGSDDTGKPK